VQVEDGSSSSKDTVSGFSSPEEALPATLISNEVDRSLAKNGKANVDESNLDGDTPLYVATRQGDLSLLRCSIAAAIGHIESVVGLAKFGKAIVDQGDKHGQTPLLIAASMGHLQMVIWLFQE
jgi:ankyrin repeat protein